MVALAPMMLLGNFVDQRVQGRRKHTTSVSSFEAELARLDAASHARGSRATGARSALPGAGRLHDRREALLNDLVWSRRPEHPEFLQVRLGTGSRSPR